MMIRENLVTFRDALMREPLPAGQIQDAVVEFLRGRTDVAIFGAQAVNVFVTPQRTTEDVDVAALNGAAVAEEIRRYLNERFHIATRVREVRGGIGYRVYQIRKPENRHLVDIRPVADLPPTLDVEGVRVIIPAELIANKVVSVASRGGKEKGLTDARDLMALLRTFPELKTEHGPVRERLEAVAAGPEVMDLWREWVAKRIEPEDEDDEFERP